MATFNYAPAEATAKRLIARFGQSITQHVISGGGSAWNPAQTETDYTLTGAVLNYRRRDVDGTLIKASDRRVIVSTEGMTTTLDTAHKLTVGGIKHSIIDVRELNPGGTILYLEAQVRK